MPATSFAKCYFLKSMSVLACLKGDFDCGRCDVMMKKLTQRKEPFFYADACDVCSLTIRESYLHKSVSHTRFSKVGIELFIVLSKHGELFLH